MTLIPILSYENPYINRYLIYKDNKNKSGIYMWTNLFNNKSYVGSSISLNTRLSVYFSKVALNKKVQKESSIIYNALLKYGYDMFKLDILEYCDTKILLVREQYYLDLLKPKYNILKIANSRLGSKHSNITKLKISSKVKGVNHPLYGKKHNNITRNKISEALRFYNNTLSTKNKYGPKSVDIKLKQSLRYKGVEINIYDKESNFIQGFPTIGSAAIYFDISNRTMSRRLAKGYCTEYIYISPTI